MSKSAVLVALIIAACLAIGTFITLRPPPQATQTPVAWLAGLNPDSISRITVAWNGRGSVELTRSPRTGDWMLGAWPVQSQRVRAAARLLTELAPLPARAAATATGDTAITIESADHATHTISLSSAALGGQIPVVIDDGATKRTVMTDAGLGRVFAREGLTSWRNPSAFPREGFDPSRIRLETPAGRTALARVGGRWAVQIPEPVPADPQAAARLVSQLGSLALSKFAEDVKPDDPALGLANPIAYARAETDQRTPNAGGEIERRTLIEEMRVGDPADVARTSLFVELSARVLDPKTNKEEPLWGPVIAVIERSRLDPILGVPAAYISRRAVQFPAADVTGVVLEPARNFESDESDASERERVMLARTLDGWQQGDKVLSKEGTERIRALIVLLCEQAAKETLTTMPEGVTAVARATARSGDAAETVVIGTQIGPDARPRLLIRTGRVTRIYAGAEAMVKLLGEFVKTEG